MSVATDSIALWTRNSSFALRFRTVTCRAINSFATLRPNNSLASFQLGFDKCNQYPEDATSVQSQCVQSLRLLRSSICLLSRKVPAMAPEGYGLFLWCLHPHPRRPTSLL